MKKRLLLLAACLQLSFSAGAAAQTATPISFGETIPLSSEAYAQPHDINVWLPPSYSDGDKEYNVLYVMDGGVDQDYPHIAGLGQLASISGQYEEFIVVGVRTNARQTELTTPPQNRRYRKLAKDPGGAETFRTFIAEDVIPMIEARYRAGGRKAVIGESLAGFFVMDTFLNHPDVFDDYISVSPSLWWDDRRLAEAADEALATHDFTGKRLYVTMADEGGTMQAGLDTILADLAAAELDGLTYTYVDRRETEHHSTIYHPAALDALRWLYGVEHEPYTGARWWIDLPEED
ncbi:alpha/beta hydrolase [Parvularcula sp. LCG005]|uniref:alpha/beta hydrolase n=1 Tax=Parvularcula sp. LCG005 TaxID=3078805 RepID=UPI0029423EEE|nr:alpha/beta hydrolase-fold protein [Parvularcula sp. LCG005]WOI54032.1 alpha/beta hydrolase-fold protein [Parvularcula sp. LCG005]